MAKQSWNCKLSLVLAGVCAWGLLSISGMVHADPSDTTLYPPVEIGAASQQIPAGIRMKIKFITPLDSKTANVGDTFVAQSAEDLWLGKQLIIPKGVAVRGRVQQVQRPGFFSKGGLMRLTFDHVVMPSGELKPMMLEFDTASEKVNRERNALYSDPGMGSKLGDSLDKGVAQFKEFHDRGIETGKAMGGGFNMLLTVPTNTIAGVATGTAVTTVNAAKAVFGKGESVAISTGEEFVIDIAKATTLQAQ